jgi:hypothetical protein
MWRVVVFGVIAHYFAAIWSNQQFNDHRHRQNANCHELNFGGCQKQ